MFARVATIFTILFFVMLAAAATAVPRKHPSDQCNGGSIECCNSVVEASDPSAVAAADLLGVDLGPIDGLVGLTCNPITVAGVSGSSCSQQTVCCTGNNFNGVLVIGCTAINIDV